VYNFIKLPPVSPIISNFQVIKILNREIDHKTYLIRHKLPGQLRAIKNNRSSQHSQPILEFYVCPFCFSDLEMLPSSARKKSWRTAYITSRTTTLITAPKESCALNKDTNTPFRFFFKAFVQFVTRADFFFGKSRFTEICAENACASLPDRADNIPALVQLILEARPLDS
jgi:hypothetical protein